MTFFYKSAANTAGQIEAMAKNPALKLLREYNARKLRQVRRAELLEQKLLVEEKLERLEERIAFALDHDGQEADLETATPAIYYDFDNVAPLGFEEVDKPPLDEEKVWDEEPNPFAKESALAEPVAQASNRLESDLTGDFEFEEQIADFGFEPLEAEEETFLPDVTAQGEAALGEENPPDELDDLLLELDKISPIGEKVTSDFDKPYFSPIGEKPPEIKPTAPPKSQLDELEALLEEL
jgi:hypothetical protein